MSYSNNLSISMTRQETILGFIYMALQLLFIPVLLQILNLFLPRPMSDTLLNFVFFLVNFVAILLIFRRYLKLNWTMARLRTGWTLQSAFLGFAGYQISTAALSVLFATLIPDFSNVNDLSIAQMVEENYSLMAIGTIFLVPIVEETLYRGLVFRGLYRRSKFAAYLVSTLVFCSIHVVGYIGIYEPVLLLLCFLQYIPAGIFLALAYARADTIFAPILMHMTINAMGILAMR